MVTTSEDAKKTAFAIKSLLSLWQALLVAQKMATRLGCGKILLRPLPIGS